MSQPLLALGNKNEYYEAEEEREDDLDSFDHDRKVSPSDIHTNTFHIANRLSATVLTLQLFDLFFFLTIGT